MRCDHSVAIFVLNFEVLRETLAWTTRYRRLQLPVNTLYYISLYYISLYYISLYYIQFNGYIKVKQENIYRLSYLVFTNKNRNRTHRLEKNSLFTNGLFFFLLKEKNYLQIVCTLLLIIFVILQIPLPEGEKEVAINVSHFITSPHFINIKHYFNLKTNKF